jgi:hypothetical protein
MQVRRSWPSVRGSVLAAVLGLAVLPALAPPGLPVRQAVDAAVSTAAAGRLLLVRHAGTAPVTVDTRGLAGPALRAWWVDGVTGETVDAGTVRRARAVRLHPPDTADGALHDWTLVVVDATRGLRPPA